MLDARNEAQMIRVRCITTNMSAAFERRWLYDLNKYERTIKSNTETVVPVKLIVRK